VHTLKVSKGVSDPVSALHAPSLQSSDAYHEAFCQSRLSTRNRKNALIPTSAIEIANRDGGNLW
jgi:hypothetical protein